MANTATCAKKPIYLIELGFDHGDITLISNPGGAFVAWGFKVSSQVLRSKSEVFRVMFETVNSNDTEIYIPDVDCVELEIFASAIMDWPVQRGVCSESVKSALKLCKLYECSPSVARSIFGSAVTQIHARDMYPILRLAVEIGDAQCAYWIVLNGYQSYDRAELQEDVSEDDDGWVLALDAPIDWIHGHLKTLPKEWIWAWATAAGEAHGDYVKGEEVQSKEYWHKVADGFRKYMKQIGEWE